MPPVPPQPFFSPPPPPPPPPAHPHLFVFGLGYVGLPFAQALRTRGWSVAGLTFTESRARRALLQRIPAVHAHDNPHAPHFVASHIASATHLVSTIPPQPTPADPVLRHYASLIASSPVTWIGYLSSTSVYGDHDGAWVHESSPSVRVSDSAHRRLAAERQWAQFAAASGIALDILRLAGIYGQHRSALHTLLTNTHVLDDTSDSLDMIVSRVHVRDITAAMIALATQNETTQRNERREPIIVNVADDLPASRRDVFTYALELLREAGKDVRTLRQPVDGNAPKQMRSSRHSDRRSKRVSNAKMKRLLLPTLSYPTYREGLLAIARELF